MLNITMQIPLETRQYKIPADVAEQTIGSFENVPIFYDDSSNNIPNNRIIGVTISGKLAGDNVVVDGCLFGDAVVEFLKFDELYSPSSIEIIVPKRSKHAKDKII